MRLEPLLSLPLLSLRLAFRAREGAGTRWPPPTRVSSEEGAGTSWPPPTRISSEGGGRDKLGGSNTPPTRVSSEGGCGGGSGLGGG
jgi:hypothetical protein